jgi:hypothetical protein
MHALSVIVTTPTILECVDTSAVAGDILRGDKIGEVVPR